MACLTSTQELALPRMGTSFNGRIHVPGSNQLTRGIAYTSIPIGLIVLIIGVLAHQKALGNFLQNKTGAIVMCALGGSVVTIALLYLSMRRKSEDYLIPEQHYELAKSGVAKVKFYRKKGEVFMAAKKGTSELPAKYNIQLYPAK